MCKFFAVYIPKLHIHTFEGLFTNTNKNYIFCVNWKNEHWKGEQKLEGSTIKVWFSLPFYAETWKYMNMQF